MFYFDFYSILVSYFHFKGIIILITEFIESVGVLLQQTQSTMPLKIKSCLLAKYHNFSYTKLMHKKNKNKFDMFKVVILYIIKAFQCSIVNLCVSSLN